MKQGAEILGGRTVNIRSLGETESEAEAESKLFADGAASIALALQFSTADILSRVDGKVTAQMNTPGGEVVKFEFDPTVPAANFKSDQTISRLVPRVQCDEEHADHRDDMSCVRVSGVALFPDYVRMGDTVQVTQEVPVSSSDNPSWSDLLMPARCNFRISLACRAAVSGRPRRLPFCRASARPARVRSAEPLFRTRRIWQADRPSRDRQVWSDPGPRSGR